MRTIALALFDGARLFDVAVVSEVWRPRPSVGLADHELRRCAAGSGPVRLGGGFTAQPERGLDWLRAADLVVVPGLDDPTQPVPADLLTALHDAHRAGATVAGLCAGAFVLAEAGLLDGRPAVTHWAVADELARRFPAVRVDPGVLFVGADRVWTSAGVAAGIDLCLDLVRQSYGSEAAATVARSMVTAPFRTGGQAQFITAPTPLRDQDGDALAAVRERALRALDQPLSVARLASWARMSQRTFARRFADESGVTPMRWLLAQRIAAAQRLLERTDLTMPAIAGRCGFGSPVTLRQHFVRCVGVPPDQYRRAFRDRPKEKAPQASQR